MSESFRSGVTDAATLISAGDAGLRAESGIAVDYLSVVDPERLEPVTTAAAADYVILAARVGATRLLDNHRLGDPFPLLT
jgi:pantoate--beta-alanine ligase